MLQTGGSAPLPGRGLTAHSRSRPCVLPVRIFDSVYELVETAAKPYGGLDSVTVIATGGDAAFFAAALPFLQLAPDEFTHHGIRLAAAE